MINSRIENELMRQQKAEKEEKEKFRRDVFSYLDNLMIIRSHNENVEREKEKLIENIQVKSSEDEWQNRLEARKKRFLVNQNARLGQVQQMKLQEKFSIEEAAKEKHENAAFNERESLECQKNKEAEWMQRLAAYHYGQELIEQKKSEVLRDSASKQKLQETLMLAAQQKYQSEVMGKEFVDSFQDVLPLHPNLQIIHKGKKN